MVKGRYFNLVILFCELKFFYFLDFELGHNNLACSGILFLHDFMYVCMYNILQFLLWDNTSTNSSSILGCEFSGPGDLSSFIEA